MYLLRDPEACQRAAVRSAALVFRPVRAHQLALSFAGQLLVKFQAKKILVFPWFAQW